MEINEFVRTDKEIGKVVYLYDDGDIEIENSKERILIYKCNITKHSKDIIDMVEVGDFVNGVRVYKSRNVNGLFTNDEGWIMPIEKIDIKSILTHQQFTQNAYVLEKEV